MASVCPTKGALCNQTIVKRWYVRIIGVVPVYLLADSEEMR